jgi:hypothetical protein
MDGLRQALCAACRSVFFVCRRCDRGQIYCGSSVVNEGTGKHRHVPVRGARRVTRAAKTIAISSAST